MEDEEELYRLMNPDDGFYMGDKEESFSEVKKKELIIENIEFYIDDLDETNQNLDELIDILEEELDALKKKTSPGK